MLAISFGNTCFNVPGTEQNILLVSAPQKEYSSMDEFVTAALAYLDADAQFADDWQERYKKRAGICFLLVGNSGLTIKQTQKN